MCPGRWGAPVAPRRQVQQSGPDERHSVIDCCYPDCVSACPLSPDNAQSPRQTRMKACKIPGEIVRSPRATPRLSREISTFTGSEEPRAVDLVKRREMPPEHTHTQMVTVSREEAPGCRAGTPCRHWTACPPAGLPQRSSFTSSPPRSARADLSMVLTVQTSSGDQARFPSRTVLCSDFFPCFYRHEPQMQASVSFPRGNTFVLSPLKLSCPY